MTKAILNNPTKTCTYPNGQPATPEDVKKRYPAIAVFPHIMETDRQEQVPHVLENLAGTRGAKGIDPLLTDEKTIRAIEDILNTPQAAEPGAGKRTAAALEFQNLML